MSRLSELLLAAEGEEESFKPKATSGASLKESLRNILIDNGFDDEVQMDAIVDDLIKNHFDDCFQRAMDLTP